MSASPRTLLPIGLLVLLGGLAGVMFLEPEQALATDQPPTQEIPDDVPEDPQPSQPTKFIGEPGEFQRPDKPLIDPASNLGMISGRIMVATSVVDKISSYTIVVQEDLNTNGRKPTDPKPFFMKRTYRADFSNGTPYFDLEDIPFSRHPYRVSIVASGVNGSSATTYITAESPRGSDGDVQLALTGGTYFSILLRDQRMAARPKLLVRMVPVGESLVQREHLYGESDNNGKVLFEDVVHGDYEIHVGPEGRPLAPPKKVRVYANFTSFASGRPTVQGTKVIVPDGETVTVELWSRHGYPVEGAKVKAWQLEVQRYYEFKGESTRAGRVVFPNMPYGVYQLSVQSKINGLRDMKFTVEKGKRDPVVKVNLPR